MSKIKKKKPINGTNNIKPIICNKTKNNENANPIIAGNTFNVIFNKSIKMHKQINVIILYSPFTLFSSIYTLYYYSIKSW